MDWKRAADRARDVIQKRGGTESLEEDAEELRGIARGPGSLSEKAREAAEAMKEPGARRQQGMGGEPGAGREPGVGGEPRAGGEPGAGREPGVGGEPRAGGEPA